RLAATKTRPFPSTPEYWGRGGQGTRAHATRFMLLAFGCGLLFFSLSGCKRSGYLVPLYPCLALALGARLYAWCRGRRKVVGAALCGSAIAASLLGGIHLVWPWYCERFCLRTQVQTDARRAIDEGVPIVCYPSSKDSFSFYRGIPPPRAFERGQRQ